MAKAKTETFTFKLTLEQIKEHGESLAGLFAETQSLDKIPENREIRDALILADKHIVMEMVNAGVATKEDIITDLGKGEHRGAVQEWLEEVVEIPKYKEMFSSDSGFRQSLIKTFPASAYVLMDKGFADAKDVQLMLDGGKLEAGALTEVLVSNESGLKVLKENPDIRAKLLQAEPGYIEEIAEAGFAEKSDIKAVLKHDGGFDDWGGLMEELIYKDKYKEILKDSPELRKAFLEKEPDLLGYFTEVGIASNDDVLQVVESKEGLCPDQLKYMVEVGELKVKVGSNVGDVESAESAAASKTQNKG